MLNIPGVEGLKVEGAAAVPKLRVGVVDCDAVKLNPVADLGDIDPNWNGADDAIVELLFPALKLEPKANPVFCCPSF